MKWDVPTSQTCIHHDAYEIKAIIKLNAKYTLVHGNSIELNTHKEHMITCTQSDKELDNGWMQCQNLLLTAKKRPQMEKKRVEDKMSGKQET